MKKEIIKSALLVILLLINQILFAQNPANDFEFAILENDTVIITNYKGSNKNVIIPSRIGNMSVTAIGENAFQNKQITSVIIPNGVTNIGDYAFRNNQINEIVIPNSVINIGQRAFAGNSLYNGITIGSNVTLGGGFLNGISFNVGFELAYYRSGRTAGFYWPVGVSEDGYEFWGWR